MRFLQLLSLASLLLASPFARADIQPEVDHDGRFIYYRTSWVHLSKEEQVEIIDASVELLKNEIQTVGTKTRGIKTLSNTILSMQVLDKLAAQAQQSINIIDQHNMRELLPAGLFIYAGGSLGAGFVLDVKGSSDVGLVIVPTEVTRVDTQTGESSTYFNLDWNFVLVPHVFVGAGVAAGGSASVGVGMIWGNLNRATDFGGWVGTASANVKLIGGGDFSVSAVRDTTNKKTYAVGTVEFDWGPEASASLDGEAGRIFPLGSHGETQVPKADSKKDGGDLKSKLGQGAKDKNAKDDNGDGQQ
jgi:hypothetical protein